MKNRVPQEKAPPSAECNNCDWQGPVDDLEEYRDFWSRVEPGNEIPAGDCPQCGAFAYLVKPTPPPPRVVVTLGQGAAPKIRKSRGVVVTVKYLDNCTACGGKLCFGGLRAVEVHGRDTRPAARRRNRA